MEQPETIVELDRAEQRRRAIAVAVIVALIGVAVAYLFVPRTLASGQVDGQGWQLRIAPLALGSEVTLRGEPTADLDDARVARSGGLDETVVWRIGEDVGGATVVVGPTPDGVDSVRVTSDLGVGEARVVRVGWRRYHVDHLPGHVEVTELVAIDASGRPTEVSGPDATAPDGG